jgi:hypothetical protein
MSKGKNCSTKERLIVIETKLDDLIGHFENHLHLHKTIVLTALGIGLTGVLNLLCWLGKLLWNLKS